MFMLKQVGRNNFCGWNRIWPLINVSVLVVFTASGLWVWIDDKDKCLCVHPHWQHIKCIGTLILAAECRLPANI